MTRRQARKLHRDAEAAWVRGQQWDQGYKVSAPGGHSPVRIAFDAGMAASAEGRNSDPRTYPGVHLPLDVWVSVYAAWLREGAL